MPKNKIKIFDNFIDTKTQEDLINLFIGDSRLLPWYFIKDVTKAREGEQNRAAMQHEFVSIEDGINSEFLDEVIPVVKKIKRQSIELLKVNAFLQFPNPSYKSYDTPHLDLPKWKDDYTILLYYLLDSDGETIIFDNNKIIKKIKPKQGRAVMFCGSYLHTAYQSKKNIRSLINFNLDGSYETNLKYANS